mmetsp:Transcript_33270/g.29149  ORF Transcript_33270/g.29149 Transcript_33270/m.29149 type:complete len:141 (-) Transcript_33270:166-588(-)
MAASDSSKDSEIRDSLPSTTNVSKSPILQLQQQLNDKLTSLNIACQNNKNKEGIIAKQQLYITLLSQELQRLQSLNGSRSPTPTPPIDNHTPFIIENNHGHTKRNAKSGWTTFHVIPNNNKSIDNDTESLSGTSSSFGSV